MSQEDTKQNERGGFPRMNRPRDDGNNTPRKGPRFSIYWVWGAIAAILVAFNLFGSYTPDAKEISKQDFTNTMLVGGDVEKVDIITNKDLIKVTIKKDSLTKSFYKGLLAKNNNSWNTKTND